MGFTYVPILIAKKSLPNIRAGRRSVRGGVMTTKMRVRELSSELGVSNKDLLHMLREQGIQVKSHMSGLTEEQVELVRNKSKSKSHDDKTYDTVTPSGVIIRRRKNFKQETSKEITEPETDLQTLKEKEDKKEHTIDKETPFTEQESNKKQSTEPFDKKQETPSTEAESELEALKKKEKEIKKVHSKTINKEPEKDKKGKVPGPPKFKRKKPPKKKKKEESQQPAVTVISRPTSVQEETETKEPQVKTPTEKTFEEKTAEEPKPQKIQKLQKKKDKRTVDVTALYEEEKEQRKNKLDWKKKKSSEIKDKTGGKTPTKKGIYPEQKKKEAEARIQKIKSSKRKIKIEEAIRVSDLAQEMGVKAQEIIKKLLDLGIMATINQSLDIDTATLMAAEFGYEVEKVGFSEEEFILPQKEDSPEELQPRAPVVTIMGHVDHGKTSLLDNIRESHVVDKEAGGITQHIGAYHVKMEDQYIVFLDTPGHEAFTEMRSRGAQITDIVILIVAADDGVMDQTKEAINHAKAAHVPIIVAINKIDKDNADPERVKRQLAEYGLLPEEWGGDTIFTEVSAKQHVGLEQLLEMILLQAEVLELKSNPDKRGRGHIIEARLDKGRGPVGTVLVQEGTLHAGEAFVCGLYHGKIRALFNDRGQKIESAGPAMPIEIQGFDGVPNAGDKFVVVENERIAKRISEERQIKHREKELAKETKVTLESFFAAKEEEEVKTLNLILKADVQGSLEAITEAIQKLSTDTVKVNIIHGGIGAITESDTKLAAASSAVIIGFNVRPTSNVKDMAEKEGVDIRFYNVIYQLVNEVKEAMAGMLAPVTKEVYLGQAEVRNTFNVPKVGVVAGCYVLDGKLKRNASIRLLRDGVVIFTGKLNSLKRFKDDVKEVQKGYECGVGLEKFNDIKINDILEAFEEVQEKATLE